MTDKIKETEVLRKHIIGENGIRYTLGEDGLYYPDLRLPEGTHYEIGRYGRMRAEYLKENHRALYLELLLDGNLNEYLHQMDEECYQMMERRRVRPFCPASQAAHNILGRIGCPACPDILP